MKTVIKINFYTQVLLAALTAVSIIAWMVNTEFLIAILYTEFLVGTIQLFFSFCWLFTDKKYPQMRKHFLLAVLNIGIIILVTFMSEKEVIPRNYFEPTMIGVTFVLPWFLAIYYWVISWKLYRGKD